MRLREFNECADHVAVQVLQPFVHMPSWIETLVKKRPYGSIEQLYQQASQQAANWQWSEVAQALAQHPRIGQKRAAVVLSQQEQQFSASEQSGVQHGADMQQALLKGNHAYEQRFGHIFLIRAAGRTGPEILQELQRRMQNTVVQEQQEVIAQLAEIALLRLQQGIVA